MIPTTPEGLTGWSVRLWMDLVTQHVFETRELAVLERALRWWDQSDAWLTAAAAAEGKDRALLIKQSLDGANAALRLWRTLKFTDGVPARRPGRPSDDDWSAKRRQQPLGRVG